jgi:multimeric flavodoxin WrbA
LACKKKAENCIVKDDLTEVLNSVLESDLTIIATPVYYGDVSSQLKGFIDRTYSYLPGDFFKKHNSRLTPGKQIVLAITQGDPNQKHFSDVFKRYEFFFKWHFKKVHLIRGCGFYEENSILDNSKLLTSAENLAEQLFQEI